MMPIWPTIKTTVLKLAAKLVPKLGKSFLRSLSGKNKGEVVPYRYEKDNKNIICLVHGFTGTAAGTFFQFPEIIMADEALNGWDVISIGYASDNMPTLPRGVWTALPDMRKISQYLETNISTLLGRYDRVAFLAHSMGGLAVQKALLALPQAQLHRISHLLLYGTPSAGLHIATMLRWYNTQIHDMDKTGGFIRELRAAWELQFSGGLPFSFVTVAGELDDFVPEKSSLVPFPVQYHARTTGNHIDMVKPTDFFHPSYQILRHALVSQAPYLKIFKAKELNNMIGDYARIVHTLQDKLTEIDSRSFREYIYALEGFRDIDAAIVALEASPYVKNNTDFMGILGGRYKRKYLSGQRHADNVKAIELYAQAYDTAKNNNDTEQVYYHAINLAFLYAYGESDNIKMRQFAMIAQTNAAASPHEGYWKYATLAEADIYLGNLAKAREGYCAAIQKAGDDKRAISSMYINAHNACSALKRNDWRVEIEQVFFS